MKVNITAVEILQYIIVKLWELALDCQCTVSDP